MAPTRLHIAIIGAGKITYSLAGAIRESGYKIDIIVSRNKTSAGILARKYRVKNYSDRLSDIPQSTNFFIIAVPDDAISETAEEISRLKLSFEKSLFIHLSGSRSSKELNSINRKKGRTASLHIMETFPTKRKKNIAGFYAAVETDDMPAEKILYVFAKKIGLIPFSVSKGKKTEYHLAGVFASNFLNAQVFEAERLLSGVLRNKKNASKILMPIIKSTIKNIEETGAPGALSGPVERGDLNTVRRHLSSLKKIKDPKLIMNYASQSLILLDVSRKKHGRLSANQKKIKEFLLSEMKKMRL